jgi:hypothetical protein
MRRLKRSLKEKRHSWLVFVVNDIEHFVENSNFSQKPTIVVMKLPVIIS